MKYVKYCIVFIIGMIILPFITHAECDYQRKAELSRIAGNVKLAYEYDVTKAQKFSVLITNITNDIYLVDSLGTTFSGSSEMSHRYDSGQTIRYTIYSNDVNCKGEELLTQYISLPYYNKYHDYGSCIGNEDHEYCKMWSNTSSIPREQFEQAMYDASIQKIADEAKLKEESFFERIWNFITEHTTIWIGLGVIVILGIIILIIRRHMRKL